MFFWSFYDHSVMGYEELKERLLRNGYSIRWLSRVLGIPRWRLKKVLRGQMMDLKVDLALKALLGGRGDGEAS